MKRLCSLILIAGAWYSSVRADDVSRIAAGQTEKVALAIDPTPADSRQRKPSTAAFAALSPGERAVAERIFESQSVTAESEPPLSLDQIAAARRAGGWNLVFVTLKTGYLTQARDAADLLYGTPHRLGRSAARRPARNRVTVVTTGAGRQLIFYRRPVSGGRRGDGERGS